MAYKVKWTMQAADEFEQITEYIALDSPRSAAQFAKRVIQSTRFLKDFPLGGRIVPEFRSTHIRERIIGSYRLIYEVDAQIVLITAIVHSRRDFLRTRKWLDDE